MVSNVNIEEPLDAKYTLCATTTLDDVEVNVASVNIHAHDMYITKRLSDVLLIVNDDLSQT